MAELLSRPRCVPLGKLLSFYEAQGRTGTQDLLGDRAQGMEKSPHLQHSPISEVHILLLQLAAWNH